MDALNNQKFFTQSVFALAADAFGCAHHRIVCPSKWIMQNGVALSNVVLGNVPVETIINSKATSIVMQRQVEKGQVEMIRQIREAFNALGDLPGKSGTPLPKLIWEIDDLITDVPYDSVHEPFQSPHWMVEENIREVLGYCDWATVPTEPLAKWLRAIRPNFEVKVIPNLLEELDSDALPEIKARAEGEKHKIGWAGGISHVGDLKYIEPAIAELQREQIKWQFMGLKPEGDFGRADFNFHSGTSPQEFLSTFLSFRLELILAPLEPHNFNDAKSNLRLIQAGAMGAAIIASPSYPYKDKDPPVFAYAETPTEWTAAIRKWIETPESQKLDWRKRHRKWAQQWGVKANLPRLAEAWGLQMPEHKTTTKSICADTIVVIGKEETIWLPEDGTKYIYKESIEEAQTEAIKLQAPLVHVRPGSVVGRHAFSKLRQTLVTQDAAATFGLSNDGIMGVDFFSSPQSPQLTGLDTSLNDVAEKVAENSKFQIKQALFPLGPSVMFNPRVLMNYPLGETFFDWGLLQTARGQKCLLCPEAWTFANQAETVPPQTWLQVRRIDPAAVRQALPPEERLILELRCNKEQRVLVTPQNPGDVASWAAIYSKNLRSAEDVMPLKLGDQEGLDRAKRTGVKWIRWEIPNIKVRDNADGELENIAEYDLDVSSADVVYCDAIGPQNSSSFRPAIFDIEWFKAWDYISAYCLIKTELWAWGAPIGRGEIFRRLLELAKEGRKFVHCPKILYIEEDTPDDEVRAQAVKDIFPDHTAKPNIHGLVEVKRKLDGKPKVSVVMLTSGNLWVLRPGLATLLRRTDYPGDWEIILGRCGEKKGNPEDLKELKDSRIKYVELGEGKFNWSALNNKLVNEYTSGEYIIFLNDDCRILDRSWLEEMIAYAQMEDVAYVGLRLVFPADGSVQHVGVYCNNGHTGHIHKQWQGGMPGYWGYARATHEAVAVTGACMAISREKFNKLGQLPEQYAYNFGDVTACLNARRKGFRNICVCPTEMQHAESSTRPFFNSIDGLYRLRSEFKLLRKEYPEPDPYWNPNLKIAVHPCKLMANGFNFELLNWDMLDGNIERVLLLNTTDQEIINKNTFPDKKVFLGIAEHGRLMLVKPGLANAAALELQNKNLLSLVLKELGIKEVIIERETPEARYVAECL